jgi:hypothetical protein
VVRVKIGPDVFAMSDGYGIGTDDDGRYVEFMTEWGALDGLEGEPETGFLEVPDWAVIAIRD